RGSGDRRIGPSRAGLRPVVEEPGRAVGTLSMRPLGAAIQHPTAIQLVNQVMADAARFNELLGFVSDAGPHEAIEPLRQRRRRPASAFRERRAEAAARSELLLFQLLLFLGSQEFEGREDHTEPLTVNATATWRTQIGAVLSRKDSPDQASKSV